MPPKTLREAVDRIIGGSGGTDAISDFLGQYGVSASSERQSKMGEKRVSCTAKLRRVFGHPLTGPKHRSGQAANMSGAVAPGFRPGPQALGSLHE
jgi:hypothetical protein